MSFMMLTYTVYVILIPQLLAFIHNKKLMNIKINHQIQEDRWV